MATNVIDNKSYIGKTIFDLEHRKWRHVNDAVKNPHTTIYFHRAINKYHKNNFKWIILWKGKCNNEWLSNLEKYYIYFYDTFNFGYNMTEGGDGAASGKNNSFCKLSHERRMEVILKGNKKRKKYKASNKTKLKMSNTRKKMYKGRNNPRSKLYKVISPNNILFIVEDGLENFCKNYKLSFSLMRNSIKNKIKVKQTVKQRQSALTENTVDWRCLECL